MVTPHKNIYRQYEYDCAYMKMALAIAELSRAERKKVGAIIVSKDDQVISQGFNGTPHGWDNCCEEKDPKTGELRTIREVLHAEANAITKCAKYMTSTKDATLYVTLSPCFECAKLIIQSEIKRVLFIDGYRSLDGVRFLKENGVAVSQMILDGDLDKDHCYVSSIDDMKMIDY